MSTPQHRKPRPAVVYARGTVTYVTVAHLARCTDCDWRGKLITEKVPPRQVILRNRSAVDHARCHHHRVIVDMRRVFDRRGARA